MQQLLSKMKRLKFVPVVLTVALLTSILFISLLFSENKKRNQQDTAVLPKFNNQAVVNDNISPAIIISSTVNLADDQIQTIETSVLNTPVAAQIKDKALVARVIDGDTIEIAGGIKVRYIGIDTPETVHPEKSVECYGVEAAKKNRALVEGKMVELEKDVSESDKYGRILRYVWLNNLLVNEYLVREGYAHSSTYPPDVKYQERILQAQRQAQQNNRGLWSGCPVNNSLNQKESACFIKANISSSGEKIYHLPGCASYEKTVIDVSKGERWFCKENEAVSAGWRKAKNC